jgi:hypothetical protein
MELGGVMVPSQMQTQYWQDIKGGKNATQAATEAVAKRNNYLLQVAIGADTPQAWSRAIEQEYDNGYLSQNDYHMLHQNFGARATVLRALQPSVTAQQDTDQLNRGYVPSPHGYVFSPRMHSGDAPVVTGQLPGPGGTMTDQRLTPAQIAQNADQPVEGQPAGGGAPGGGGGGTPSPAVAAVTTVAPGPFADYAGVVHTHEGFKPTMGEFGWSPKTKVEQARLWAPQEVAGLTDQQIVAKQLSPQAEAKMLQGFTANNSVTLQNAGIRPSAANLFMSHYIGPQGMINLNKVPPNMTMAEMERRGLLAPGTVANNPELQGNTTTGGFIDWAQRRAGNNTITPDNIDGRSTDVGPGPGGQPGVPRQAAAPGGGGGGGGATYQSAPQRAPGVAQIIERNITNDSNAVNEAHSAAIAAHGASRTVNDMRDRIQPLKDANAFGFAAGFRTNALSVARTLAGTIGVDDLIKKIDGWDFGKLPDREAFIKEAVNLATAQEAAMPGVRSGIGLTTLIGKGSPSLDMQGDTVKELLDRMIVGHQMTMDYANDLSRRTEGAQTEYNKSPWTNPYEPVQRQVDDDWNTSKSIHNPRVYLAAANLINGKPKGAWDKAGLTDPQKAEAVAIARRADPSWVPVEGQY